jgi:hypothetical protein
MAEVARPQDLEAVSKLREPVHDGFGIDQQQRAAREVVRAIAAGIPR